MAKAASRPRPAGGRGSAKCRRLAGALGLVAATGAGAEGLFEELPAGAGLDFVHFNGMSGELYFAEMTGGGAALVDYDGDGDLDAYLVQGTMLGDHEVARAVFPPRHPLPLSDRLYRNDLEVRSDGTRRVRFVDVTAASGLAARGYGMGVASGDFDNDGRPDLYLANFGPNQLLRNEGNGTFRDVTAPSGTDDPRWSVPALFFDYDCDGWLDLYVGNYVDFRIATHKPCVSATGATDYCGPLAYRPEPDRLFRNRGDGTFEDVSLASGIGREPGAALGAVAADFNGDGWPDLYVANDGMANFLWINQRDGTFEDEAVLGGAAVSEEGAAQASMGVAVGDLDGDGALDLFMTHLTRETNTLYLGSTAGFFTDASRESGLALPSWGFTGFGVGLVDYDHDGREDLFVANGAVTRIEEQVRRRDPHPLHQTNQLFRNGGGGRFEEVTASAGETFGRSEVSRGVASGDVDLDGDADLLVANNAGPARLLLNQVGQGGAWLGLRALDAASGRDLLGTVVRVTDGEGRTFVRRIAADGSYASASEPRAVVGLAMAKPPLSARLAWPEGGAGEWRGVPARRTLVVPRPERPQ